MQGFNQHVKQNKTKKRTSRLQTKREKKRWGGRAGNDMQMESRYLKERAEEEGVIFAI